MPHNVVFIVLDTFRKDHCSVYNDAVEFTEHLEQFADEAVVYEDTVAQAPWTLPSHASMFTGEYPWEHGAHQKNLYLETDTTLLAEQFKEAGYDTACYTSNTWISPYTGMAQGFDDIDNFFPVLPSNLLPDVMERIWQRLNRGKGQQVLDKLMQFGEFVHEHLAMGSPSSKSEQVVEKAEAFMDDADDEFFLFLNFMDAHLPYHPPEQYREEHAPDVDLQDVCQSAVDHNSDRETADFDAAEKLYRAEVDYLDDVIGNLFETLEQSGRMEDTVVVVVADHGENLGEDGMFGHQFSVSEQLVSVPLIIYAPDGESGTVETQVELRELYDLVPAKAGIAESGDVGTDRAKGRYAYPRLDLKNVPEAKHGELGQQLTYVRGDGKKLVQAETAEGNTEDTMIDLSTDKTIPVDSSFVAVLDDIGQSEEGQMLDDQDAQVKDRLEDLGYI